VKLSEFDLTLIWVRVLNRAVQKAAHAAPRQATAGDDVGQRGSDCAQDDR